MVTADMTVTPIEAMYDTDAEKIVCYRKIKERNGVLISLREGEWITPKKDFEYILFDTFKEAADYADTGRQELQGVKTTAHVAGFDIWEAARSSPLD